MARSRAKQIKHARSFLLMVWAGVFLLNLGVVFYKYLAGWLGTESFTAVLKRLSGVYAPYLGVILMFYWGKGKQGIKGVSGGLPFWLALVFSLIWNAGMAVFILFRPMGEALALMDTFGSVFSWLVAGAVGYYFAHDQHQHQQAAGPYKKDRQAAGPYKKDPQAAGPCKKKK